MPETNAIGNAIIAATKKFFHIIVSGTLSCRKPALYLLSLTFRFITSGAVKINTKIPAV